MTYTSTNPDEVIETMYFRLNEKNQDQMIGYIAKETLQNNRDAIFVFAIRDTRYWKTEAGFASKNVYAGFY